MTDHEILRFVNSKDIRKYLGQIDYHFSTVEAAWLVSQCHNATFAEKQTSWIDIINTMPDQSIDSRHFASPYESIHKVIADYIEVKSRLINTLIESSTSCFYKNNMVHCDLRIPEMDSIPYSTYAKCCDDLIENITDEEDLLYGSISRSQIDSSNIIIAYYNQNGDILDINSWGEDSTSSFPISDFFNLIWLNFPVPFKNGDILFNPYTRNGIAKGPVLMQGIASQKTETEEWVGTDTTDMCLWGFFVNEDTGVFYRDNAVNYMDYEYCPEELLIGPRQQLKSLIP